MTAMLLAACQAQPVTETVAKDDLAAPANVVQANAASPAADAPAVQPAARYRFTGTEPFWGGTIDGSAILYQTPEDQAGAAIPAAVSKEGAATRFSGTLAGQPFVLTLTPGTCSDGMSDTVYPLNAALTVNGEQRQGCASPIVGTQ